MIPTATRAPPSSRPHICRRTLPTCTHPRAAALLANHRKLHALVTLGPAQKARQLAAGSPAAAAALTAAAAALPLLRHWYEQGVQAVAVDGRDGGLALRLQHLRRHRSRVWGT